MLKVTTNRQFVREVTVLTPVGKDFEEEKFSATFAYLGVDELNQYDLKTPAGTTDFLNAVVIQLDGLADAAGAPLQYDSQVRDAVFRMPNARHAIVAAYFDAVTKVKSGN